MTGFTKGTEPGICKDRQNSGQASPPGETGLLGGERPGTNGLITYTGSIYQAQEPQLEEGGGEAGNSRGSEEGKSHAHHQVQTICFLKSGNRNTHFSRLCR